MTALGLEFSRNLVPGTVLAFEAPLGAGKTTFIKGLGRGLEIPETITSPTYTIISEYYGRLPLYHMDFYRIRDPEELSLLGVEEFFYGRGICAVEWCGIAAALLPPGTIRISMEIREDGSRLVAVAED